MISPSHLEKLSRRTFHFKLLTEAKMYACSYCYITAIRNFSVIMPDYPDDGKAAQCINKGMEHSIFLVLTSYVGGHSPKAGRYYVNVFLQEADSEPQLGIQNIFLESMICEETEECRIGQEEVPDCNAYLRVFSASPIESLGANNTQYRSPPLRGNSLYHTLAQLLRQL